MAKKFLLGTNSFADQSGCKIDRICWEFFALMARRKIHLSTESLFCSVALQKNRLLRRFRFGGFEKKIAGDLGDVSFWKRMATSRSYSVHQSINSNDYDLVISLSAAYGFIRLAGSSYDRIKMGVK